MQLARLWRQAAKRIMDNRNAGNALAGSRIDNSDQVTCVERVDEIGRGRVQGLPLQNVGLESITHAVADRFAAKLKVNDLDVGLAISVRPGKTGRAGPIKRLTFVRAVLGKRADKFHGRGGASQYLFCGSLDVLCEIPGRSVSWLSIPMCLAVDFNELLHHAM